MGRTAARVCAWCAERQICSRDSLRWTTVCLRLERLCLAFRESRLADPTAFEYSVQMLKCFGSASLDVRVPVGRCGGMRLGEKVPSLLGVAWCASLDEHLPPRKVGAGGEELGVCSLVERGGLGEVGVSFVVTAEDSGEAAEVV